MKLSISYKAQEVFDKALASAEPDPYRPITGSGCKVWADEPTGTLCKVSTLSGTVMGFVSVGSNHPWFDREDCPLPGISSYGTISHPVECRGLWWFYFALDGNGRETIEKTMQKCRILAAQLEIEGTELAQQIAQLSLLKRTGSVDEGEDDHVTDDKLRSKVRNTSEVWGDCTLTTFPTLDRTPQSSEYDRAYENLMECIQEEIAKYASDDELENITKYMHTN